MGWKDTQEAFNTGVEEMASCAEKNDLDAATLVFQGLLLKLLFEINGNLDSIAISQKAIAAASSHEAMRKIKKDAETK